MSMNYHFSGEDGIASPQLVYYRDIIEENIDRMIAIAGGAERLWPHVKSHKMKDLVRLQMEKGIRRFKCATVAEAEMVASAGADALILAYPLVGPNVSRFAALVEAYPAVKMYAIEDSTPAIEQLSALAQQKQTVYSVLMDVDMGMQRTGVPLDQVDALYRQWSKLPGISMEGMHCYDGNRHEHSHEERQRLVDRTDHAVLAMKDQLNRDGFRCETVVMGGTPSFPCHAANNHEYVSPGTGVIQDAGYQADFPDIALTPGAAILTRVISLPGTDRFTLDCGYKAVAADPAVRGVLLGVDNCEMVFQNEEHWVFRMKPGHEQERPAIGEIFYIIPWHICPTSALYSDVPVVSGGEVVDRWVVTARSRRITY